jgi:hypothetical protein
MVCESPLELEHEDGSTATGQGADAVITILTAEQNSADAITMLLVNVSNGSKT